MAEFSFTSQTWPDGTTVRAYEATGYSTFPGGGALGSPVASSVVSGNLISFTGLTDKTPYFAAAEIEGEWHSALFVAGEDAAAVPVLSEDLEAGELSVPARGERLTVVRQIDLGLEAEAREEGDLAQSALLSSSGKGFVDHGAEAGKVRPAGFASVEWHGSVEPENAVDGDTWIDTS